MPANLPPQYVKLEQECRRERDPQRRLDLLERMLSEIPKHKGTSHLQGELKSKISKTRTQLLSPKKSGVSRHQDVDHIPKEGAGQFVLFGPPNSGKSSILGALTNAQVEITEWPFATRRPQPGMARWENISMQFVDTPSMAPEFCDPNVFNVIRTSDVAVLVLSLGNDNVLDEYEFVVDKLLQSKIRLAGLAGVDPKVPNAQEKPTLIVTTGLDLPESDLRLSLLREVIGNQTSVVSLSIPRQTGLDELRGAAFNMLGLFRVYTKAPGRQADQSAPILLPHGGQVGDAAREIHKEFAENFQYARLWSMTNSAIQGSRVPADHLLEEGDILEFHV